VQIYNHIRCRRDLIEIQHKEITDEDLEMAVSVDDDVATKCTRNLGVLAKIMKLLVEKLMASGDEEFDGH
jgi:hypothetical protein